MDNSNKTEEWFRYNPPPLPGAPKLEKDAFYARICFSMVDRAGDYCEADTAEQICDDFYDRVSFAMQLMNTMVNVVGPYSLNDGKKISRLEPPQRDLTQFEIRRIRRLR